MDSSSSCGSCLDTFRISVKCLLNTVFWHMYRFRYFSNDSDRPCCSSTSYTGLTTFISNSYSYNSSSLSNSFYGDSSSISLSFRLYVNPSIAKYRSSTQLRCRRVISGMLLESDRMISTFWDS